MISSPGWSSIYALAAARPYQPVHQRQYCTHFKHRDIDVLLCLHPQTIGAVCEVRAARLAFAMINLVTRSLSPHGVVALNGDR